ncbi:phosphate ABC transporter substrate-binding protein PstS [Terracidiphilus sp.]|uniref:phosphate ABC transporter substrate-binding protein PstS n=1 Tax=Terracidiphilus sp. TaxID=1964191 RepID=UPI003C14CE91
MRKTGIAVGLLMLAMGAAHAQKITGAGASFPLPIYSKWFSEYSAGHPGVEVNYQSIGSGGGIVQVTQGKVDFGASDMPMTDAQLSASSIKLLHIPTVMGAVVPVFNVPGVTSLKFSGDLLADIYLNKITNWNDPRIAKDNPGVSLPDKKIIVVHRSDGSGTSFIFTDYLSKVSHDWNDGPGKGSSPNWPTGVGGKGNEGVAGLVRQMEGSIGYVELLYALQNKITFGEVKNADGNWVRASIEGVTAAAATAKIPADYRVSITNAPGANSYPISSFTYLLIPVKTQDAAKKKVLVDLLSWIVKSGEGEASGLSYAPLPQNVADQVLKTVYSLQ